MKKRTVKRGLYRRETTTPETDAELIAALKELSRSVETYVANKRQFAEAIVQRHGIDPKSLFDVVRAETREYVRFYDIDRDLLPAAVDQALRVIECCRDAESVLEIDANRNALSSGIHLAEAVEHLKANLAWEKPVGSRQRSDEALKEHRPRGREAAKKKAILKASGAYPADRNRAAKIALRVGCTSAYVRAVLRQKK